MGPGTVGSFEDRRPVFEFSSAPGHGCLFSCALFVLCLLFVTFRRRGDGSAMTICTGDMFVELNEHKCKCVGEQESVEKREKHISGRI